MGMGSLGLGSRNSTAGWTRQKALWVEGRIGASPAEEQGASPHPHWEGGATAPRPRMQGPDLLEREEERPFWGPSVQSWVSVTAFLTGSS